jgi:hypothetical protein
MSVVWKLGHALKVSFTDDSSIPKTNNGFK